MFDMKKFLVSLMLLASIMSLSAYAGEVAGKIAAVRHEKVTVNKQVLDKVTVVVDDCLKPGQLTEVYYNPATISDLTVLGHLFDETTQSARTANMPKQQMFNGHGLFFVDEQGTVQRAGLLGHPISCNQISQLVQQFR